MHKEDGLPRLAIMGTEVSVCSFAEAVSKIGALVTDKKACYISCANAYSLSMAWSDAYFRDVLNQSEMTTADGVPVVWALHLLGKSQAQRVHNDDLVLACCEQNASWKHFLVGGAKGQPEEVARAFQQRFPNINIVGSYATPMRPVPQSDNEQIIKQIKESKADVVWVGMGTPAQDYWMSEHVAKIGVPLVACGSLFDLLSGRTKQAPEWVKKYGLQWFFRLLQEPRRLFIRYAYHNTRFIIGVIYQLVRKAV